MRLPPSGPNCTVGTAPPCGAGCSSANPRLRPRTREFADQWFELVSTPGDGPVQDRPEARRIVRERERALKSARARLTYAEARDRRSGYPFSDRQEYRWTQVKTICADILSALEGS